MNLSVASVLFYIDPDGTEQTRLFIRMIDKFFDYNMNVKDPQVATLGQTKGQPCSIQEPHK